MGQSGIDGLGQGNMCKEGDAYAFPPKCDKFEALCSAIEESPYAHLEFSPMIEFDLQEAKLEALEDKFGESGESRGQIV